MSDHHVGSRDPRDPDKGERRGFFALSMQEHLERGLTPEQWRFAAQELYAAMRSRAHWHEGAGCTVDNCPAMREQGAAAERARIAGEEARAWSTRSASTGPRRASSS
jgi:hypothetical protein